MMVLCFIPPNPAVCILEEGREGVRVCVCACVCVSLSHMSDSPWEMEGEVMTRQKPLILFSSILLLRLLCAATVSATL